MRELKLVQKAQPACLQRGRPRLCYLYTLEHRRKELDQKPMFLSLLLSALTLNPAMAPQTSTGPTEGFISAPAISPDSSCKPGNICASSSKFNRNGCFFNNFYNGSQGGTPLTINITQTGANGSKVFIYWVNATNQTIGIKGNAQAKFYCPKF